MLQCRNVSRRPYSRNAVKFRVVHPVSCLTHMTGSSSHSLPKAGHGRFPVCEYILGDVALLRRFCRQTTFQKRSIDRPPRHSAPSNHLAYSLHLLRSHSRQHGSGCEEATGKSGRIAFNATVTGVLLRHATRASAQGTAGRTSRLAMRNTGRNKTCGH